MNPIKRWLFTYVVAVDILHAYGERAWPHHVHLVWSYAKQNVKDFLEGSDNGKSDVVFEIQEVKYFTKEEWENGR
jgi:hypothetical protein